jgi:ferredoxin
VRKRIAVIGSGPSSWATYMTLQRLHQYCCEITILDANMRESKLSKTPTIASKSKMGSTHMYSVGDGLIELDTPNNYSLANGGLSTVWGAGIRMWDQEILAEYGWTSRIYESALELLAHLPYSGDNSSLNIPNEWNVIGTPRPPNSSDFPDLIDYESEGVLSFVTALAVDVKSNSKCVGCGDCLSGCSYGSIFDTGNYFDKYQAQGLVKRQQFFVEKIISGDTDITIQGRLNSKEYSVQSFHEVYLCAGALGTPAILLRSKLIPEKKMEVLDSQVFYFAGLKRFKKSKLPSFALSQITISGRSSVTGDFKASLYRSNPEIRLRMTSVLKKVTKININIPKFIDNYFFVGIGFLNSRESGTIQIVEENEKITISSKLASRVNVRKSIKLIQKFLISKKMFVLPLIFEMPTPGLGFHSGGSLSLNSDLVDEYGRLRADQRVKISDVSILKSIPAGPHTFTAMAIVSSIIKSEYENSNHGA